MLYFDFELLFICFGYQMTWQRIFFRSIYLILSVFLCFPAFVHALCANAVFHLYSCLKPLHTKHFRPLFECQYSVCVLPNIIQFDCIAFGDWITIFIFRRSERLFLRWNRMYGNSLKAFIIWFYVTLHTSMANLFHP